MISLRRNLGEKDSRTMADRYFTLNEANALLPWLEERLKALTPLLEQAQRAQEALDELRPRTRVNGHGAVEEELRRKHNDLRELRTRLRNGVEAVEREGVIVRDLRQGLVDFPSIRDSKSVYLCWVQGEPEVVYWHDVDAGFGGRQPL